MFAQARGADFRTPLWHWTLTWPEGRFVPAPARPAVSKATRAALRPAIELPQGFSFAPPWSWRACSPEQERRQRERWCAISWPGQSLAPSRWLELAHGFAAPYALRVHVGEAAAALDFNLLLSDGSQPLAYASRRLELPRRSVEHAYLAIVPGSQGSGVGAQLLANALVFYRALGLQRIELTAGLSSGGAVWAKFGFCPVDEPNWQGVKRQVQQNLHRLPPRVAQAYERAHGQPLAQAVSAVLAIQMPQGIWALTDLDPGDRAARAAALDHGLAGALLRGSRWRGILNLQHPVALRRIGRYLQAKIDRGAVQAPPLWP